MSDLDDLAHASAETVARPPAPRPTAPRRTGTLVTVLTIAAVVIGLGFAGWMAQHLGPREDDGPPDIIGPPPPGAGRREATKADAWVATKYFVKTQLTNRATADFGPESGNGAQDPNERVLYVGGNGYHVTGWVESRDASGAAVRNNFDCYLRYSDREQWQLDQVKILPPR